MSRRRFVLIVSRYPPAHTEAPELRARAVARTLARRGHDVVVMTSRAADRARREELEGVDVRRVLGLSGIAGPGAYRALRDVKAVRSAAGEDATVIVMHASGLSPALLSAVRPRRTVLDVASDWLLEVGSPGNPWWSGWADHPDAGLGLRMRRSIAGMLGLPIDTPDPSEMRSYFWSRSRWKKYLAASVPVHAATLLTPGVDVGLFPYEPKPPGDPVHLLLLGRIDREHGLHSCVLALGDLPENVRLRVAGRVSDAPYLAEVGELGVAAGVMGRVELAGAPSPADLPALIGDADLLLYPYEHAEPFPRRLLEAFARGTPVVGVAEGLAAEALHDGETGLTFPAGNVPALATAVQRVLTEPGLREKLVEGARRLVSERFAIDYTVEQIERISGTSGGASA